MALAVIMVLYVTVGLLAAAGSIAISRKIFSAKAEQIFFGLFLIAIAGFYLAFAAYFGNQTAGRVETSAVAVFAVLGLLGIRLPFVLILGYVLHGFWDLLHELQDTCRRELRHNYGNRDSIGIWGFLRRIRLVHGGVLLYPARPMECSLERD